MLAVDLVILTLRDSRLHVLLVERGVDPFRGLMALPGGFLSHRDEPLQDAARRELWEEAGLVLDHLHLDELGVYATPRRDPRGRVVSVAHLAILPRLPEPVAGTDAVNARWEPAAGVLSGDVEVAFDHREIVGDGVERARRKLEHSSLATAFCAPLFTLSELQRVYEAVWGVQLDPRNFYRKVRSADGFVVPVESARATDTGRPARLFRAGSQQTLNPPMVRAARVARTERSSPMKRPPIVILTALELEYAAVRDGLVRPKVRTHEHGTRFEVGRLGDGETRVALALVGKGNHSAAVLAGQAIAQFAPAALIFVGVAGALQPHIELGDVVIATHIYAYHGATSEDDGDKSRPRVWETSHRADQIARHVARGSSGRFHFGPIAAGEVVLNSRISDRARWIREHYNDALAIEMEGAGVAQAAHLSGDLPAVVVRGISDRADGTKEISDRDQWQQKAIAGAAAFAMALAAELFRSAPDSPPKKKRPRSTGTTRNVATGNSQVGVQARDVNGGIHMSNAPEVGRTAPQPANFRRNSAGGDS
jgi:8-oxo-dGTP diphosphatase